MTASFLDRILFAVLLASAPLGAAWAAGRAPSLPSYDVKATCANAREFSKDFQSNDEYESCLADEANARRQLAKIWPTYSARQKRECLEPGPDRSYVETLTCLQMDTPPGHGSDVGGPVAPGLDTR